MEDFLLESIEFERSFNNLMIETVVLGESEGAVAKVKEMLSKLIEYIKKSIIFIKDKVKGAIDSLINKINGIKTKFRRNKGNVSSGNNSEESSGEEKPERESQKSMGKPFSATIPKSSDGWMNQILNNQLNHNKLLAMSNKNENIQSELTKELNYIKKQCSTVATNTKTVSDRSVVEAEMDRFVNGLERFKRMCDKTVKMFNDIIDICKTQAGVSVKANSVMVNSRAVVGYVVNAKVTVCNTANKVASMYNKALA